MIRNGRPLCLPSMYRNRHTRQSSDFISLRPFTHKNPHENRVPWLLYDYPNKRSETPATWEVPIYKNYINGKFTIPDDTSITSSVPILNPATNTTIAQLPNSTPEEVNSAIEAATNAFPSWSQTSVQERQRIMFSLQGLIQEYKEDLANLITLENGKTLADAKGDVFRGLEVVENCCEVGSKLMGENLGNISSGMDCVSYRVPLGVCAGIGKFLYRPLQYAKICVCFYSLDFFSNIIIFLQ
jgi:hypothetical protein